MRPSSNRPLSVFWPLNNASSVPRRKLEQHLNETQKAGVFWSSRLTCLFQSRNICCKIRSLFPGQTHIWHLRMWIKQKQRDLSGIEVWHFRNHRKGGRLVGRCAGLGWCHNVTRHAPPLRQPLTIIGVRRKGLNWDDNDAHRGKVT